ncbi:hypothetical protein [Halobaculum lipolyticum]|uniref:DUF7847 domain-containing protein n=1 Tax=Halobaculum lipolyticum TaxID=3032001 RepID=A0ABD5W4I0_9EURY|nr:hypothetical protein [Halobaculum sp. DT31]
MSRTLQIGTALSDGVDKLSTRGGLTLAVVLAALQVVAQVGINSLSADLLADSLPPGAVETSYPLALPVPAAVSGVVVVLAMVAALVVSIVAMRAVYADIDEVPTAEHTRRLARTAIVLIVVSVITQIAFLIGLAALFFPGLFLLVSLVFAQLAVVIEDRGVVDSLKRSWSLAQGNRIRLFALGVIVVVAGSVVFGVVGLLGVVSPALSTLGWAVLSGFFGLFSIAVLVSAYRQLADAEPAETVSRADLAD